jgi:sugar (pentulose or hexulose) kinase
MAQVTLIGVDLGTSVVKTTLFDVDGQVVADATRPARLHQWALRRLLHRRAVCRWTLP